MPQEINGQLDGSGLRIAVVAARFNSHIVESLVDGPDGLTRHGVAIDQDITVLRCPGSWELPMFAQRLAERDDIDGGSPWVPSFVAIPPTMTSCVQNAPRALPLPVQKRVSQWSLVS